MTALPLTLLPGRLAVCRLDARAELPSWAPAASAASRFVSITRTDDELSIVCPEEDVPPGFPREDGFRAMRVAAVLDFALVGILAALLDPLASAGISVFAVSTHDTDYVLVRERDLDAARAALTAAGHTFGRSVEVR